MACATAGPGRPPVDQIAGVVRGVDGRPIEGVRVLLQSISSGAAPIVTPADPMVRTDARGRFVFVAPPDGRYQLLLLHGSLGWMIAQGVTTPSVRGGLTVVFDPAVRVVDIGR